jgi:hypothetical protein
MKSRYFLPYLRSLECFSCLEILRQLINLTTRFMKKGLLLYLIGMLSLIGCEERREANALLTGTWQGAEWLIGGDTSSRDASTVRFQFDGEGAYIASYGSEEERGVYRLKGDKLYTTAKGQIEKMVALPRMSADTLFMEMNRVGQKETLILVKQ